MSSTTETSPVPQKQSHLPIVLCLLVVGYLGYQLHREEKRTTPEPQTPLPTFESRIEPLREHASDWDAGYFYMVGNHQSRPVARPAVYRPQARVQPQSQPQPQRQPAPAYNSDTELLRDLKRQNAEWDQYMRSLKQHQRNDEW